MNLLLLKYYVSKIPAMKNTFDCNCDTHDKEIVGLYLPKSNRFVKVNVCANDLRSIISEPCIFVKEELEYVAEK